MEFEQERAKDNWAQAAGNVVQMVRVSATFESQINQMVHELKLRQSLYTDLEESLRGDVFNRDYKMIVPPSHRPKDTMLYLFLKRPDGTLAAVQNNKFSQTRINWLCEVVSLFLRFNTASDKEKSSTKKPFARLFGEDHKMDQIANIFKGELIPTKFLGKDSLIIWDSIEVRNKNIGAFLLAIPFSAIDGARPLSFAIKKVNIQNNGMISLLIPLQSETARMKPVFPPGGKTDKTVAAILPKILASATRDVFFPLGKLSTEIPDVWVYRDFLLPDKPYEIVVAGKPSFHRNVRSEALAVTLSIIIGATWLLVLCRGMTANKPLAITMRFWVISFIIFLAVISLSSLFLFGSYYIEITVLNRIKEEIKSGQTKLEKIDADVSGVVRQHTDVLRSLTFNHSWCEAILNADDTKRAQIVSETISKLENASNTVLVKNISIFDFDPEIKARAFSRNTRDEAVKEVVLDFFRPFFINAAEIFQHELASPAKAFFENQKEKGFSVLLQNSLDRAAWRNFLSLRQNTDLWESESVRNLIFYDFIAQDEKIKAALLFLSSVEEPYKRYLTQAAGLFNIELKNIRIAYGSIANGGFDPLYPEPGGFWNESQGKKLKTVMDLAAQTKSDQIKTIQFKKHFLALIAHPCDNARGYVLGASINLDPINEFAASRRIVLNVAIAIFLILTLCLAYFASDYLLEPLSVVEEGLRRVSAGDLAIAFGSERNDELGDLHSAFNKMIQGIRERRELGFFVSKQLDSLVSANESKIELAPGKKIGTILISDIRNFTTLSETYPARDIIAMLNEHLHGLSEIVQAHGGFVELFIGDAIVAAFFDKLEGDAARAALTCAVKMMEHHHNHIISRRNAGKFSFDIGIGIDRGQVIVGTIGTTRLEYTILGSPRNQAEKLEALSKKGRFSKIIVSPDIVRYCPEAGFDLIPGSDSYELIEGVLQS